MSPNIFFSNYACAVCSRFDPDRFEKNRIEEVPLQSPNLRIRGEYKKAGSKGRESGSKVGSKFGQSNNNTKHAPIGMKFGV